MKISKLQLIVITIIGLALIIAIIMMSSRQPPKPKAIVPKYEVQTEEQSLTGTGRFELPEEEYGQVETMKEELIPEKAITELEAERQSKTTKETALTATEQTGTQTKALESEKLQKKYPTPKKLREIKERGLVIY
ncbi:MAG: hypothetical protein Q8R05_08500 [Candidatus Omnitrophota bacterium]|nr:hypothetical protein [Candidatus Omnitrophota bacterium]